MERLDDLLLNDLKIYQDDNLYNFTSDAVLLSKFAQVKKGDVIADFCSGSGIVGIHLYGLNMDKNISVDLFEIQESLYNLSKKSVKYNNLEDKIFCHNVDLKVLPKEFYGKFSLVCCNPPYMEVKRGETMKNDSQKIAKAEVEINLEQIILSAKLGLKFKGRFCLVLRADRLIDTVCLMKKHKIEPKKLQFVVPKNSPDKTPYLFLIEGVFGGNSGIKILPNLEN